MVTKDAHVSAAVGEMLAGVSLIDAHQHFWELSRFPYRWLAPSAPPARFGDKAAIRRDYLPKDYLENMRGLSLAASVHVQANCGAKDPVDETRWLQELSERTGYPTAAVAEVDLTRSDAVSLIARHASFAILRGVRTPVAWDTEGRWRVADKPGVLRDPAFLNAARTLAERNLCLEMVVIPEQLAEVAEFASANAGLKIVINHFATLEPTRPGNLAQWLQGIRAISRAPNIYLKLSGLWTADRQWSPAVLAPCISEALDVLGSTRMMYGSNLPVESVNCPAIRQFEQLAVALSARSQVEIENIFNRTACEVYRIEAAFAQRS